MVVVFYVPHLIFQLNCSVFSFTLAQNIAFVIKNKFETSSYQDLLTKEELSKYLRIPEVSDLQDYHNVVEHLKRVQDLPRIHICKKTLYPLEAVRDWLEKETGPGY